MISIPNPCNEDFEQMSPTERGAFCEVCSIDTFDFRQLSTNEIYEIVDENKGKHICGRFNKSQLDNLNPKGFANWKNQSSRTFQSKFLLACVLVFGLTLFSCDSEEAEAVENFKTEKVLDNYEPLTAYINQDADLELLDIDLMDYVDEDPIPIEIKEYEAIEEIAGGLSYTEYEESYTIEPRNDDYVLGGAIVIREDEFITPTILVEDDSTKSTLSEPIISETNIFQAKVFPNPTQGPSTISLGIENEGKFDIMLYTMSGQLVTSVYSGHLVKGRQQFDIDLTEHQSGMYIVKVISQGQNETLKIQKLN